MWRFLLSTAVCIGVIWALSVPLTISGNKLPPLGKFLSPSHGFWHNAEHSENIQQASYRLAGLQDEVRIVLDERLVPHVFASNVEDLYFAQGFVTAQHRLWQMDISTRAAAGRVSEILGPGTVAFDKQQRRIGLTFAAENAVRVWEAHPEGKALADAYTAGINAYIDCIGPRDYPLEFKLLHYRPEPWTLLKTALFIESMSTRLCMREFDLEYTLLRDALGTDYFDYLFPDFNPTHDPVIPSGTQWPFVPVKTDTQEVRIPRVESSYGGTQVARDDYLEGSNNWALSGARTASGQPILCNDPHLHLSLPSTWYEIHLNAPGYNCYGVSLPGIPGIIIGFNDAIAWGMTNAGHDVLDWYHIAWTDSAMTHYMLDGQVVAAEIREEIIRVAGGAVVIDSVPYTIWGPAMDDGPHAGLAMRWLAHDAGSVPEPLLISQINRSTTIKAFFNALDDYHSPAQNYAYADTAGNIAMYVAGTLPLRKREQGKFIQDGSKSDNAWPGVIPKRQNPMVINPERGFVSSANQISTDTSYPYYYLGGRYFEDYRGHYLNRRLAGYSDATVNDMQELQNSAYSLKAEEILPTMLEAVDTAGELAGKAQEYLHLLSGWDYVYDAGAVEPTLFDMWYSHFYDAVWDEFDSLDNNARDVRPEAWRTNELAIHSPGDSVFDITTTPMREDFTDIAMLSFRQMVNSLDSLGEEPPVWGAFRITTLRHLANLPGLNIPLSGVPGHGDALNANKRAAGPSWRMIVHLTDPVEAYVVYPGGQSGNPGSPYYDDMVGDWVNGRYHKAHFTSRAEEITAHMTIHLKRHN